VSACLRPALLPERARRPASGKITITGEGFGDVRFDFADEVAVQWLPDVDTEEGQAQTAALREVVVALARFVQRAVGAHLDTLPDGVVTRHG